MLVDRDYHLDALQVYPNDLLNLELGREGTPVVG